MPAPAAHVGTARHRGEDDEELGEDAGEGEDDGEDAEEVDNDDDDAEVANLTIPANATIDTNATEPQEVVESVPMFYPLEAQQEKSRW